MSVSHVIVPQPSSTCVRRTHHKVAYRYAVPHAWFVAIAPVEQPQFAIAVIVERGGEGSRSALPVARQVLAAALGVQ